ncbi:Mechanosensitive ion channel protein 8 [Dichanthelium oligosanthes]|uniref:Mechanosensitive ion channel protein n=1 Tax=Dichanthelium oligosanthes TaxID=888268 RepID=A0A1E5VPA6_9POAL|nr:Mechanosensitive ion channel protein 8 [Dichanthelium oligosanthes]
MDQARRKSSLHPQGSGKSSSRPEPGALDPRPAEEVVVKIDGNGNGHAPFSFHGADGAGGSGWGKAGNATSGTYSAATTTRTASGPRSGEASSPQSPAKVWREGSYEFWNNDGGGGVGADGRPRPAATEAFSFKNRPPQSSPEASSPTLPPPPQQQPSTAAEGGGMDPPTRLIGNFLRRQAASGGEMSLDLDLEMEELWRTAQLREQPSFSSSLERDARVSFQEPQKRRSTSSCSSDSDTDDGRKRGGDDGEVVRCTSSSTAAGAGPLLRAKTRSRLMDPPPQSQPAPAAAAAPVIDEELKSSGLRTPTKSAPRFSGHMSGNKSGPMGKSGPMDEEEEDPFADEDIPDDFKSGKLDALTVLQWLGLFLIIAALVCSLTIRILSKRKVLGMHLWRWELLVFVLICGRLISGWVIRIAVFFVERNFLLRKRVLYFVYGVRSAVQNALWLGLVLASWHFLFDKNVQQETNSPVLPYVTKILFCFLVATLIRLVKTLLLKVLASSFHVSTYFDRIQEALFNQYVIETLSGPPLVDENRVLQEVHELQRAGATIPEELRDTVPTRNVSGQRSIQLSGVMPKGEGSKQLSKEKGEGISIDMLHKLNQKNVSAWNMKRLMRIVRYGTLTTMDEQIQQATGEGDESATQIRSEYEAKIAAKRIFHNVATPGSKYIYLSDLMRFMRREEAIKAMDLFEGAQEHNRVSKRSLKSWVVNAFRERKALALTLNDTKTAVNKLNQMANVVVGIIVFALWLLILGIATTHFFVFLSSQLLLAVFVFGNTLKTVFEAIVFLFVMHPFDVGDRCEIEGVQVVVEEMNIMTTVFLRYDNLKIYYPNTVLATKPIMNYYRSPDMGEGIDFSIHVATPVEKLALMKERILRYIDNKKEHWYPGAMVVLRDVDDTNKLKVSIWLRHTLNFQDMGMRFVRRELVLQEMIKVLKDLEIEYRMLPLDVNIRNAPPIQSTRMPTTWSYS